MDSTKKVNICREINIATVILCQFKHACVLVNINFNDTLADILYIVYTYPCIFGDFHKFFC